MIKRMIQWSLILVGGILLLFGITNPIEIEAIASYPLYENTITSFYTGINHSFALTDDNRVFGWGANTSGQVGNNTTSNVLLPVDLTSFFSLQNSEVIVQIEGGLSHTLALTNYGRVFAWGSNTYGQLGNNSFTQSLVPLDITSFFGDLGADSIIYVDTGFQHSFALTENGQLYAWGYNFNGQLGNGTRDNSSVPFLINSFFQDLGSDYVIQVVGGASHSVALTNQGKVFTWGYNSDGQLGDTSLLTKLTPVNISPNFTFDVVSDYVTFISAGAQHNMALTHEGKVYGWGINGSGQVGTGAEIWQRTPYPLSVFDTLLDAQDKIIQLDSGANHSVVLTENGMIYSWGDNSFNQLGDGSISDQFDPINVTNYIYDFLENERIEKLVVGGNHTIVLSSLKKVRSWGFNVDGQLGNNSTISYSYPKGLYPKLYQISYETNGGSEINPFLEEANETIHAPIAPIKEGNTFIAWYTNPNLTFMYIFNKMPAEDFTLYAKWNVNQYSITFNTNGGTTVDSINELFGAQISSPEAPTKVGYTFAGWYTDIDLSVPYEFSRMPSQDMTLFAKWDINQYVLTFDTKGGLPIDPITQDYNSIVSSPSVPQKEGNTFVGWFLDDTYKTPYVFSKMPAYSQTIYAQWTVNTYTFSFDTHGGSTLLDWSQKYNTLIVFPIVPTKVGYTFNGWFIDDELTQAFDFDFMPPQNMTLHAKWNLIYFDILYHVDGGSIINGNPSSFTIEDVPVELNPSTKDGYIFLGWYLNSTLEGSPLTNLVFNQPQLMNVYTKWLSLSSVNQVISLIQKLPEEITIQDKTEIILARNGYEGLSIIEKTYVTNIDKLIYAETLLESLPDDNLSDIWIISGLVSSAIFLAVLLFIQIKKFMKIPTK